MGRIKSSNMDNRSHIKLQTTLTVNNKDMSLFVPHRSQTRKIIMSKGATKKIAELSRSLDRWASGLYVGSPVANWFGPRDLGEG